MGRRSEKDTERVAPDDKRTPEPRNEKKPAEPHEQPEPLDEESLDKVMRETPL